MKRRKKGKSNDSVATPEVILKFVRALFHNEPWYDPCPLVENVIVDGLFEDWTPHKYIYVNPPFSCVKKWVRKSIKSFQKSDKIEKILMLIKAENFGNNYIRDLHKIANVYTICHKIKFVGYDRKCGFSNILLEFTRNDTGKWQVVDLES
jgi:hypothetical protein